MANEPNYSSNPSKDEPKKEKVRVIPLEYIDEFPGHPFKVLDDESMQKLMNSMSADEEATLYGFNAKQNEMLDELLSAENAELWAGILGE